MADHDNRDTVSGGTPSVRKSGSSINATAHGHLQNIATMKAYLLTQGFTAQTLNTMTRNDLVYAARQKLGIG